MPRSTLLLLGILWLILTVVLIVSQVVVSPAIKLEWQTETEFETAGFNILKSERDTGVYTQINDKLIASQADPAAGASYVFTDEDVVAGRTYYYRLEDVEFDNTTTFHEVVTGEAEQIDAWALVLIGICFVIGMLFLITAFRNRAKRSG